MYFASLSNQASKPEYVVDLSIREYLREKAAESRHKEMSAYLMFIAGSVLFVGGILETLTVAESVNWIVFIPVEFSSAPGVVLGLSLTLSGLALGIFGLGAGTYFARDRSWYMKELGSTSRLERSRLHKNKQKRIRVQAAQKQAA